MVGKDGIEQIEKRSLFLSHAHADRELSTHLQDFVQLVYSGLVETFVSSSPTAGIGSGEEWFQRIHVELRRAERVWVIATPVSVSHPWIYWEAGVGRALCEGGVTPVCVGISVEELPSPLNQFQAYDALANDGNNLRALAADVAAQMGMDVADVLLQNAMDTCSLRRLATNQRLSRRTKRRCRLNRWHRLIHSFRVCGPRSRVHTCG